MCPLCRNRRPHRWSIATCALPEAEQACAYWLCASAGFCCPCTGGIYVALLTASAAASSIAAFLVGRHDGFRHLPALESHGDVSTAADTTGNREHIAVGRSSLERQGKYKQQYDREYRGAHPTSFSEISTKIMSFTGGGSKASRGNIMKPTNAVKAN